MPWWYVFRFAMLLQTRWVTAVRRSSHSLTTVASLQQPVLAWGGSTGRKWTWTSRHWVQSTVRRPRFASTRNDSTRRSSALHCGVCSHSCLPCLTLLTDIRFNGLSLVGSWVLAFYNESKVCANIVKKFIIYYECRDKDDKLYMNGMAVNKLVSECNHHKWQQEVSRVGKY